jgi:hypothetical protein
LVSGRAFNQIFDPARLAKSDAPADRGGRAPRSGRGGRRFKSCHSDQLSQDIQSLRGPICGTKPVRSQAHLDLRLAPTRVDQRCMRFSALPRNSLGGHPSARRRTRHFGDRKGASATRELAPASRYRGSAAAGGCTIIAGPSSEFQRRSQVCRGYGRQWSRCLHRLRNRLPDRRWGRQGWAKARSEPAIGPAKGGTRWRAVPTRTPNRPRPATGGPRNRRPSRCARRSAITRGGRGINHSP